MGRLVSYYLLGSLITGDILGIWFESTICFRILSKVFGVEFMDYADFADWVNGDNEPLADLLSCVWCLGTWVSVFISTILCVVVGLNPLFILASMFSWPILAVKVYRIRG